MAEAARSGNPAVRALAGTDNRPSLEREADEDGPVTFEFADQTWEIIDDFKLLRFQRLLERQLATDALEYALGSKQYALLEDEISTVQEMFDMSNAIAEAMGVETVGESRASRRSSRRTARR